MPPCPTLVCVVPLQQFIFKLLALQEQRSHFWSLDAQRSKCKLAKKERQIVLDKKKKKEREMNILNRLLLLN